MKAMTARTDGSGSMWKAGPCLTALAIVAGAGLGHAPAAASEGARAKAGAPLVIERQGAFAAGGRTLGDPASSSVTCDHGHVEYQVPRKPRAVSLFLYHSSSAAVWQRRWDGGEGFQQMFLRRGYPVYMWDGPRVGRANWGCEDYGYKPAVGADQANFRLWRLGAPFRQWFDVVQFPKDDPEAWDQAMRARYAEFDTVANARLETDAAAAALEKIGPAVLVTNSAAGFRSLLTALKSDKVRAIVAYENPGYIFPEGEGPQIKEGPFGPLHVPKEEFARLTRIPMQFVWGDNIDKSPEWQAMRALCALFVEVVNAHGGKAEILDLPAAGLRGNTHIPMADLNNEQVAELMDRFLRDQGLDRR